MSDSIDTDRVHVAADRHAKADESESIVTASLNSSERVAIELLMRTIQILGQRSKKLPVEDEIVLSSASALLDDLSEQISQRRTMASKSSRPKRTRTRKNPRSDLVGNTATWTESR